MKFVISYIPIMWFPQSILTLTCLPFVRSRFVVRRGRRQREFCGVAAWCIVFLGMVSRGNNPHKPNPRVCAPYVIVAMILASAKLCTCCIVISPRPGSHR